MHAKEKILSNLPNFQILREILLLSETHIGALQTTPYIKQVKLSARGPQASFIWSMFTSVFDTLVLHSPLSLGPHTPGRICSWMGLFGSIISPFP